MTNMPNMQFDATFMMANGEEITHTLVLHRCTDELEFEYQNRFANIVSFKNGVLHDIKRIEEVQFVLNTCGYGVSNMILIDVTCLVGMAKNF